MQGTNGVMQVKLTNVAVVRLKRNGIRFEVAAYKNKVVNWRSRVETDINEVLQVPSVFTNVSRGIHAKASDLAEAFGTDDSLKCAMMILDKGEFEVGELERQLQYDTLFRDIATTVAEKCVNPTSRRPYPLAFIEKALRDVHFSVIPTKTAKQQALKAITSLKAIIPIERSKMHLRLMVGDGEVKDVRGWLEGLDAECIVGESAILGGEDGAVHSLELQVDPGLFRVIEEAIKVKAGCSMEVLSLAAETGVAGSRGGISSEGGNAGKQPGASGGGAKAGGAGVEDGEGEEEESEGGAREGERRPESLAPSAAASHTGTAGMLRNASAASEVGSGGGGAGGGGGGSAGAAASGGGGGQTLEAASARGTGMLVRRVVQPGKRLTCNTCGGVELETPEAHKEHHRTDWHRLNCKRKVQGLEPLAQEDFDALPPAKRASLLAADC